MTTGASESFRRNQFSWCPGVGRTTAEARRCKAHAESLHFFSTEPLFLIRFGLRSAARKPGGHAGAESPHFFLTEPLFLIPFGLRSAVRMPGGQAGVVAGTFFRRNHFSSFPRLKSAAALSPAARSSAPRCREIVEFWQHGKRTRRCSDCFRQHPDAILAKVAKEMAPLGEMPNL